MKQLLWLMLMIRPIFSVSQENNGDGIRWVEGLTWEQIQAKAKAENRFVFVDAYATWCMPCKKMDKEVYLNEKVGKAINSNFISVKVQMDSTSKDNANTRAWYPIAQLLKEYKIEGYPSFLFFAPDGKLAYKDLGYRDIEEFINLAKDALTDPNARYEKNVEKFRNGQLPFTEMTSLARDAWYKKKDKDIAIIIANKYKTEYADKLEENKAYTRENLYFIAEFFSEIKLSTKDRYFKYFFRNPELADSIINCVRSGKQFRMVPTLVSGTIQREEITQKLYKDGKIIEGLRPKWERIKNDIKRKYGQRYVNSFFPEEQIRFYRKAKNWSNYAKYVNKKIEKIPPKVDGKLFGGPFGDAWQLNGYAWTLFLGCNDKKVLREGLAWVNMSLKLEEREYSIDTKANLLYKLGKISEAIVLEEKAVSLSNNSKENFETLQKMKNGLPTWPQQY